MSEYDLKKSVDVVGTLPIPIFKDERGQIIDGNERTRAGVKCPVITLPIKDPVKSHITALIINACRRDMAAEEKTRRLVSIAELSGRITVKKLAEILPFSEDWIRKYLPESYKDKEKAKAGAKGGEALAQAYRESKESALDGRAESQDFRLPKEGESEEEFCKRFAGTVRSHVTQLLKRDFPVVITHMSESHDCSKCGMSEACDLLLNSILKLKDQLPFCMAKKLRSQ